MAFLSSTGTCLLYVMAHFCLVTAQVTVEVNPGCVKECDHPWLVHGYVNDTNITTHHLWSAMNKPTFLVMSTINSSRLIVNYTALAQGENSSLHFETASNNSMGFSIQNIILHGLFNQNGSKVEEKTIIPSSNFTWKLVANNDSHEYSFVSTVLNGKTLPNEGKIQVNLFVMGTNGRSIRNPQLQTTSSSAQADIVMTNLNSLSPIKANATLEKLRWSVDMVLISSDKIDMNSTFSFRVEESFDDEYTPGSFSLVSLLTPSSGLNKKGGFYQWRPVSYLCKDRNVEHSVVPQNSTTLRPIDTNHLEAAKNTLLQAYYGSNVTQMLTTEFEMIFPTSSHANGAKFDSNYTVWTFSYGLGEAPMFRISVFMKLALVMLFGIPVVIFAIIFIFIFNRTRTFQSQYQPL